LWIGPNKRLAGLKVFPQQQIVEASALVRLIEQARIIERGNESYRFRRMSENRERGKGWRRVNGFGLIFVGP
jgi:hypothetical protein